MPNTYGLAPAMASEMPAHASVRPPAMPGSGCPVSTFSWLNAIRKAAPEVNPTMTEWETKFINWPSRAKPSTS